MTRLRLLLAALTVCLASALCEAADYFVAPSGSDAAGDGSVERPFETIGKALDLAQPGDRVVLRAGEYRLAKALTFPRGGSEGNPITVTAFEGEYVALLGSARLTGWELVDSAKVAPGAASAGHEDRIWKVRTPEGSNGGMVRGLYEDAERLTHPRPDWGKRENPPLSELKAPGTWTQEGGYIYLWTREGDSPDNHRIEASQHGVVNVNRPWVRVEKLHLFFGEPTVCVISADHCEVVRCEIAHCSNSVDNAYGAYVSGCSWSAFRDCVVHDSFYWGDHGSNSHVVSCIDCGDSGPNFVANCDIFNGGLGVGTKGAAREMVITDCRISDVVNGVVTSGERVSGPGAGKTDRGHYLVYRNHVADCALGVYFYSGKTHQNRVWSNLIERCGTGIYMRNYEGEPEGTDIANNVLRANAIGVQVVGGRTGEETIPLFVAAGLRSYDNLFDANRVDWRNPLDWSRNLDMTLAQVKQYRSDNLEAGSLAAPADLDEWGRANPGSPAVGAGAELPLPDYVEKPSSWDIGLGSVSGCNTRPHRAGGHPSPAEPRPEPGLTLSIAGSATSVGPGEEVKLRAALQNEFREKAVGMQGRDLILTFHFRYLGGHFDKQELYRTRVQLPDTPLSPGESLDLTRLPGWRNPTNGVLGDPFHLRVDTKDWRAGCRLAATARFVERSEGTAASLQKLEDLIRSKEVLRVTLP